MTCALEGPKNIPDMPSKSQEKNPGPDLKNAKKPQEEKDLHSVDYTKAGEDPKAYQPCHRLNESLNQLFC